MSEMKPNALVIIPSRLGSSRLPDKPLADIRGEAMIVHVWRRSVEAGIGEVVVACDHPSIKEVIEAAGGRAVLTRADHPSGSDRIFEALSKADPEGKVDVIVNVQGDLPTIAPTAVRACFDPLLDPAVDVATLTAEIVRDEEKIDPNVVKVIGSPITDRRLRALYFTRATAPYGDGPLYHHIGLYAYRRSALARFVSLPPSTLEKREKLEQLRLLEAGMRIDAVIVDDVPLGVDTQHDLDRAREIIGALRKI